MMTKSNVGHFLGLAAALALAGCEALCAVDPPNAITVKVVNAATGAPICDASVFSQGEFDGQIPSVPDKCEYILKSGPTGPYSLFADRDGFQGAGQDVMLASGECGFSGISLTLSLQPK